MKHWITMMCVSLAACAATVPTTTTGDGSGSGNFHPGTADYQLGPCVEDNDCGSDGACINNSCTERCGVRPPCTDSDGNYVSDCQYYSCSWDTTTTQFCFGGGDTPGVEILHHHQEGWSSGECLNLMGNGEICPRGLFDYAYETCSTDP